MVDTRKTPKVTMCEVRTPNYSAKRKNGIEQVMNNPQIYQFQELKNNPMQEMIERMPFQFKWSKLTRSQVKPSKFGYTQAANSMLKTIDFNCDYIRDWAILESGATSHFLVTDATETDI